ncbi:MAG: hypothetical protein DRO12_04255 [Thermoprotei archaeon]|nr:MAG: hypothetical protein DRO12_04255 [Thermoprotei archaeon]
MGWSVGSRSIGIVLGILVGLLLGFIDSYSYAVSGFTTAELSILIIPVLMMLLSEMLKLGLTIEDIMLSSAIAMGMDLTTTLTSGMYITYGFLEHLSSRLAAFGLSVKVPPFLFALKNELMDFTAMPLYLILSMVSVGGAFIAYAVRRHFFDMERLPYPLGMTVAIILSTLKRFIEPGIAIAFLVGALLQAAIFRLGEVMYDLTPVAQVLIPGVVIALSFNAITFFLALLLPKGSLYSVSAGSLFTYLGIIPLTTLLGYVVFEPLPSYESALFTASPLITSMIIGYVAVASIMYVFHYRKVYARTMYIILKLRYERLMMFVGFVIIGFMLPTLYVCTHSVRDLFTSAIMFLVVLLMHPFLTFVNLRIVGEVGFSSQALFPLATAVIYGGGVRDVSSYAIVDPFTGIPMPQLVGGTAMNLLRAFRVLGARLARGLTCFVLGMVIGAPITYVYGNILVKAFGFDSPLMPLTKWIPTVVWMSVIYSGGTQAVIPPLVALGALLGAALSIGGLTEKLRLSPFAFVLGMSMPPDIGVMFLIAANIKSIVLRMGVELHEKLIIYSTCALIGAGITTLLYTILTVMEAV